MKKYDEKKMSKLEKHGFKQLNKEGLFGKVIYGGMLGDSVMELLKIFSKQNHSGYSASIVRELFNKLSNFKPLNNKITNNIDEWVKVEKQMWQNKSDSTIFTNDMKYYFCIDEDKVPWFKLPFVKILNYNSKLPLHKIEDSRK